MKKTRRIAAMIAALAMAATMAVPFTAMNVSAAGNTITINAGTGDNLTHAAMAAYQIFQGEGGNVADTLNVTGWGSGVTPATFVTALKDDTTIAVSAKAAVGEVGDQDYEPAVPAKTIADLFTEADVNTGANTAENAQAVSDIISQFKTADAAKAVARAAWAAKTSTTSGTFHAAASESSAYIDGLNDGYYAVFDTTKATNGDNPAQGAYTLGLLKVSNGENVNVTTKVSLPTFEKNILDVNDSSSALTKAATGVAAYDTTTNTWAEDADHDKGDNVPFQLVATIPSNYAEYKEYWLKMHDNLQEDVFTLNNDFVVYYVHGGTKTAIPDTAYTTITTNLTTNENFVGFTGDTTEDFTIEFANLKSSVPAIEAGDKIVVEYSALLTEDANVGSAGNWNGAYLEYVNNPNWEGTGTPDTGDKEKTPEDIVVAFTYQTDFTKLDAATSQPLSGAVFALYKKYATAPTGETACTETGYTNYYKVGGNQTSAASTGSFGWSGLDDGDYVLVEITPPTDANGVAYNAISPIPFTITAEHGNKALTSLNGVTSASTGNDTHINLNSGFVPIANDTTKNAVVSYANGSIDASIANSKETTLPSTGGMGTILFYTVGGIMVVGAGVVLVTKKRSKNEQ